MLLSYDGKGNSFHSISDHDTEKMNMTNKMMGLYEHFESGIFSNLAFKERDFSFFFIINCSIPLLIFLGLKCMDRNGEKRVKMYLGNRSNAKCITYKPNLKASESLLKSIGAEMAD